MSGWAAKPRKSGPKSLPISRVLVERLVCALEDATAQIDGPTLEQRAEWTALVDEGLDVLDLERPA